MLRFGSCWIAVMTKALKVLMPKTNPPCARDWSVLVNAAAEDLGSSTHRVGIVIPNRNHLPCVVEPVRLKRLATNDCPPR